MWIPLNKAISSLSLVSRVMALKRDDQFKTLENLLVKVKIVRLIVENYYPNFSLRLLLFLLTDRQIVERQLYYKK